jgi:RHS repeat-associated protein
VNYAYSFNLNNPMHAVNHSRLTSMTYPSGRVLDYGYNTGTGWAGIDDRVSRLSFLADGSGGNPVAPHLEDETYLGLSTIAERDHPQPNVNLTYIKQGADPTGDAGDQYIGLDRFGRVVDQRWLNPSNPTMPTDRFLYGYDRDGNRLYRDNGVNQSFGEIYHANAAGTGYDNLNQLTAFYRGQLSATKDTISGTPQHSQAWSLDVMGNWSQFNSDTTTQTRGANRQNETTFISGQTTPTYDYNGNTTKDDTGKQYVYDAWNRIVKVKDQNGVLLGNYAYDALGRRIQEPIISTSVRDLYFSTDWQVLEERDTNGTVVRAENVWSPVYVDALILRDRDPSGAGSFGERLYVQQDANWNVTAVVGFDTPTMSWKVMERYVYDPYGRFTDPTGQTTTVLNPDWTTHPGGSQYAWVYLHQGGRFDIVSGLYYFRYRDYSPTLGRWTEQDPAHYHDGPNLYAYLGAAPTVFADPFGLCSLYISVVPKGARKGDNKDEKEKKSDPGLFWSRCIPAVIGGELIEPERVEDMVDQILKKVKDSGCCIGQLTIRSHGAPGVVWTGPNEFINESKITPGSENYDPALATKLASLKPHFCKDARIVLWTCKTGQSQSFLDALANLTGVLVHGVDVDTDKAILGGGDWHIGFPKGWVPPQRPPQPKPPKWYVPPRPRGRPGNWLG